MVALGYECDLFDFRPALSFSGTFQTLCNLAADPNVQTRYEIDASTFLHTVSNTHYMQNLVSLIVPSLLIVYDTFFISLLYGRMIAGFYGVLANKRKLVFFLKKMNPIKSLELDSYSAGLPS